MIDNTNEGILNLFFVLRPLATIDNGFSCCPPVFTREQLWDDYEKHSYTKEAALTKQAWKTLLDGLLQKKYVVENEPEKLLELTDVGLKYFKEKLITKMLDPNNPDFIRNLGFLHVWPDS